MSLSRSDALLFMGPVDRTTVLWSLSFKAPESRAAELHALFKDPKAAQVGPNRVYRHRCRLAGSTSHLLLNIMRLSQGPGLHQLSGSAQHIQQHMLIQDPTAAHCS